LLLLFQIYFCSIYFDIYAMTALTIEQEH